MDWIVKRSANRDAEREHLNRILKEIRAAIAALPTSTSEDVDLSDLTTSDVDEGSNLYYTDNRVTEVIGATSIDELVDVDTATTPPDVDDRLVWDGTKWVPGDPTELPFVVYLTTGTGGLAARDMVAVNASGEAVKAQANDEATKAIGYVKSAFSAAATAKVYLLKGTLTGFTGLTIGTQYYLSSATAGEITAVPVFTANYVVQYIGTAYSTTAIEVNMGPAREVGLT